MQRLGQLVRLRLVPAQQKVSQEPGRKWKLVDQLSFSAFISLCLMLFEVSMEISIVLISLDLPCPAKQKSRTSGGPKLRLKLILIFLKTKFSFDPNIFQLKRQKRRRRTRTRNPVLWWTNKRGQWRKMKSRTNPRNPLKKLRRQLQRLEQTWGKHYRVVFELFILIFNTEKEMTCHQPKHLCLMIFNLKSLPVGSPTFSILTKMGKNSTKPACFVELNNNIKASTVPFISYRGAFLSHFTNSVTYMYNFPFY